MFNILQCENIKNMNNNHTKNKYDIKVYEVFLFYTFNF